MKKTVILLIVALFLTLPVATAQASENWPRPNPATEYIIFYGDRGPVRYDIPFRSMIIELEEGERFYSTAWAEGEHGTIRSGSGYLEPGVYRVNGFVSFFGKSGHYEMYKTPEELLGELAIGRGGFLRVLNNDSLISSVSMHVMSLDGDVILGWLPAQPIEYWISRFSAAKMPE